MTQNATPFLRPIWRDPRTHYAVNCASLGCPNLAKEAYTGARKEVMLELAAKDFVNHPRGVTLTDGALQLSSIYDWFAEDFGADEAALIQHLIRYGDASTKADITKANGRIGGYHYDWSLNDAD